MGHAGRNAWQAGAEEKGPSSSTAEKRQKSAAARRDFIAEK